LQLAIDRSSFVLFGPLLQQKVRSLDPSLDHLYRDPSVDQPHAYEQVLVLMRLIPKFVHMQKLVIVVGKTITWWYGDVWPLVHKPNVSFTAPSTVYEWQDRTGIWTFNIYVNY